MTTRRVRLGDRALAPFALGTASLGSVLPDALVTRAARRRAFDLLDAALEAGIEAVDTAASYMIGGTERLLGEWLASEGRRARVLLVSKGCHPVPVLRPHRLTPRDVDADLHASLRRLRTERIDLYLLHRDDPGVPIEPMVLALARHVEAGKIGAWGVSNWTHARVASARAIAMEGGLPLPAASSPQLSLVAWSAPPWKGSVSLSGDAGREGRAFHAETQLPVLAWSPLGNGYFAHGARPGGPYDGEESRARRARAEELGTRLGCTGAQVALAYLFHQPFPVVAVLGASRVETLRKSVDAAALDLSAEDVTWLETGRRG